MGQSYSQLQRFYPFKLQGRKKHETMLPHRTQDSMDQGAVVGPSEGCHGHGQLSLRQREKTD